MQSDQLRFMAPFTLILVSFGHAADLHLGYSDRQACVYRDGFHVPTPLRRDDTPIEWGVLKLETPVKLRVQEMASTERAQPGDRIDLEVVEDVRVDGFTVIRKGAEAWGTIERASKGPGTKTEWLLYDPYVAPTPLGQRREFPTQQIENGRLSVQVQGAYDITGGQVALYAADVIGPQDHQPSWELDSAAVLIWQALSYPVGKVSGKKMPSITGHHAVLSKGTEITALVDGGVCYDLTFLQRVQDLSEPRMKLKRRTAQ